MTVEMRRSLVTLSLLLALSSFAASAQEDARAGLPGEDKFFAGGGFGFGLSDDDSYDD